MCQIDKMVILSKLKNNMNFQTVSKMNTFCSVLVQ